MLKTYKFRVYPNKFQEKTLKIFFGSSRFLYNQVINKSEKLFEKFKKLDIKSFQCPTLEEISKENNWINSIPKIFLRGSFNDATKKVLDCIENDSWEKINLKKKKNKKQILKLEWKKDFKLEERKLFLGKQFNYLKIKNHREINGKVDSLKIEKTFDNKYYIKLFVIEDLIEFEESSKKIGIDFGINTFAVVSDGSKYKKPYKIKKYEEKIIELKKILNRKKKLSKNFIKLELKIEKLRQKIVDQNIDFIHKLSSKFIRENQTIVIEDFRVNKKRVHALDEVCWSKFRKMLEYKANWYGRKIIVAPTNYKSSQICSCCGYQNKEFKNLESNYWICPICKKHWQRNENSSLNLLKLAM